MTNKKIDVKEIEIAIFRLTNAVKGYKKQKEMYGGTLELDSFTNSCEIAIACMGLQVGKKPIKSINDDGDRIFSCPSCEYDYLMIMDDYGREWHELPFCECGQKIDWKGVDDD